jgi:hypothetical protein
LKALGAVILIIALFGIVLGSAFVAARYNLVPNINSAPSGSPTGAINFGIPVTTTSGNLTVSVITVTAAGSSTTSVTASSSSTLTTTSGHHHHHHHGHP